MELAVMWNVLNNGYKYTVGPRLLFRTIEVYTIVVTHYRCNFCASYSWAQHQTSSATLATPSLGQD